MTRSHVVMIGVSLLAIGCSCASEHQRDADASARGDAAFVLTSCDEITDAQLMAAVYGGPLVPEGFYDETYGPHEGAQWRDPCSASLEDTRMRAIALFGSAALTGTERSSPQFHEVDVTSSGFDYHYRNTRCDYFDGATLGTVVNDPSPLKALVDYLWFVESHDLGGSHVIAGIERLGDATQGYDLCFVTTTYGDFGLCDRITLRTRSSSASFGGGVTITPDVDVRSLEGECH